MDSEQFTVSPESARHPEQSESSLGPQGSPEVGAFESGAEHFEQRADNQPQSGPTTVLPQVVVNPTTQTTDEPNDVKATTVSNPTSAKDSDSIEKEWVNRVKHVLQETKDDPYKKEEEVKSIKIDYLDKRYNRKLGSES
ncbi:MAG: hypothetical protein LBL84_03770 [Candidatus Nomurabacteria bacterium]|jgi:hypothetical protein|nr:hypothetical protein [Candidatus Nomurabacteria bacterium]